RGRDGAGRQAGRRAAAARESQAALLRRRGGPAADQARAGREGPMRRLRRKSHRQCELHRPLLRVHPARDLFERGARQARFPHRGASAAAGSAARRPAGQRHALAQRGEAMNVAPDIAIAVEGLTKSFDGRVVVRNLSMQVKRGTIYGFLGPNGSGKTTTIRMLCGLLTPDSGRGTALGFDIRTDNEEIKRHVGYMTQRFSLYQDLSILENLEFVARVYGLPDPTSAARAAVDRLGLAGRGHQPARD